MALCLCCAVIIVYNRVVTEMRQQLFDYDTTLIFILPKLKGDMMAGKIPVTIYSTRIRRQTLDYGFWIAKPRISDSMSKIFPDFVFHKQRFPGFWNLDSFTVGDSVLRLSTLLPTFRSSWDRQIFYLRPLPAKTAPTKTAALIPPTFIWNVVSVWISLQNSAWRMIKNT